MKLHKSSHFPLRKPFRTRIQSSQVAAAAAATYSHFSSFLLSDSCHKHTFTLNRLYSLLNSKYSRRHTTLKILINPIKTFQTHFLKLRQIGLCRIIRRKPGFMPSFAVESRKIGSNWTSGLREIRLMTKKRVRNN